MHGFEFYDDRFSCPNCQEALPHSEVPQTCDDCGFIIEVFLSREDAVEAMCNFEEDPDSITTRPCHVYSSIRVSTGQYILHLPTHSSRR